MLLILYWNDREIWCLQTKYISTNVKYSIVNTCLDHRAQSVALQKHEFYWDHSEMQPNHHRLYHCCSRMLELCPNVVVLIVLIWFAKNWKVRFASSAIENKQTHKMNWILFCSDLLWSLISKDEDDQMVKKFIQIKVWFNQTTSWTKILGSKVQSKQCELM